MIVEKLNIKSLGQLQVLLVTLLAILLNFKIPAAFIVLPLLVLVLSAIKNRDNLSLKSFRISKKGYLLTALFAIHFAWFIKSVVATGSLSYFEKTLPFLLFPIMISATTISSQDLKMVFAAFIFAVLLSYSLSLVAAIYHYFNSIPRWGRPSDFFFHEQFTAGLFDIHPTYYSLLGCLATLILFQVTTKWYRFLIVLILTIFIILINARITILIQILLIISFLVKYFHQGFTLRKLALIAGIGVIILVFVQVTNSIYDYPHRKILVDIKGSWDRSYAPDISDGDGGLVTRFAIWRSATQVIKDHPVFGIGLDNEKQALATKFKEGNVPYLIQNSINAHNQLLSYLIAFGLIGCTLLSLLFVILAKDAYSKRCWPYFEFLVIFVIVSMTESIFNRGHGIAIFAFFNSLLFLKYVHRDE
ncbi:MAG TPA: O-antigen ligase family protein [Chitinophagaceae bacterium]